MTAKHLLQDTCSCGYKHKY